MLHYVKNERGFTMLECIVFVFVLFIILMAVTSILPNQRSIDENQQQEAPIVKEETAIENTNSIAEQKDTSIPWVVFLLAIITGLAVVVFFHYSERKRETVRNHVIITNPILELEAHLEDIIEDATTKELFQSVIKHMHELQNYHTELDSETKHLIEYSLTNDLNRLLTLYEVLNENQKENLAVEIQKRLHLMQEKVTDIKAKLDEKKASEIKKALHLFDKRYQV